MLMLLLGVAAAPRLSHLLQVDQTYLRAGWAGRWAESVVGCGRGLWLVVGVV